MDFEPVVDSSAEDVFRFSPANWPPAETQILKNDFVELHRSVEADAEELFTALNHDEVWAHVKGRPANVDEMRQLIVSKQELPGWYPWTIRTVKPVGEFAAGQIVGTTSYLESAPADSRTEIGSTLYAPTIWGSFVNPATKLLLLEFAFETMKMARVQLKTDVRNQRSQRAIARLGAKFEGTLRLYQARADCSIRDTVLFSIVIAEWPEIRAALEQRLSSE